MQVFPVLELMGGHCVRPGGDHLGRFKNKNIPILPLVEDLIERGFSSLYVIDRDAWRGSANAQKPIIESLVRDHHLEVYLAGSIQDLGYTHTWLNRGVKQVILSRLAVDHFQMTAEALAKFGHEKIGLKFEVSTLGATRRYIVKNTAKKKVLPELGPLIAQYQLHGVQHIVCRDLTQQGTLMGPQLSLYKYLTSQYSGIKFTACGGIRDQGDLAALEKNKINSAIVNRAVFEGDLSSMAVT